MLHAAQQGIQAIIEPGQAPRDYATTLLVTVVTNAWVAGVQVGDGALIIQYAQGAIERFTWPSNGEYANETTFITSADVEAQTQYMVVPRADITGLALQTDGIKYISLDLAQQVPAEGLTPSCLILPGTRMPTPATRHCATSCDLIA